MSADRTTPPDTTVDPGPGGVMAPALVLGVPTSGQTYNYYCNVCGCMSEMPQICYGCPNRVTGLPAVPFELLDNPITVP